MENSLGLPEKFFFFLLQISQHINVFRQDNSQRLLEFIKHYKQNPLEIFFFQSIFTKNYFGFNVVLMIPVSNDRESK